jgi:hypothetical protein
MATGARGESYLELDGERYTLLYTNRAIAEAEKAIGRPAVQIVNATARGDGVATGDIANLLAVGLEYARRNHLRSGDGTTSNDAWRLLDGCGYGACLSAVIDGLVAVLSYSPPGAQPTDPPA